MLSRRRYLTTLTASAAAAVGAVPPERKTPPGKAGIRLALMQNPGTTDKMRLSKQIGVDYSIVNVQGVLRNTRKEDYVRALQKVKDDFASYGLAISAVESHPVPAEKIKLGAPGRDEEIENYQWAIDALSKVGIHVLCYNWMAGLGWYRTKVDGKLRGDALTSEFDNEAALAQGPTQWGTISEEQVWDSLAYFQKRVMPVAEKAGMKMALHPDDPPLSPLRGIGRILTSAKNYRRVMDMAPSPINGVTFCQANFVAMGENIEALAKDWLAQKKIFFIHFRDVEGNRTKFRETFHDNGPTDMARMLQIYHQGGFDGAIRPDHAPTIGADTNDRPGYAYQGKILAIGYMKGVLDGMRIPYL
jgi:mannonate dehydratase